MNFTKLDKVLGGINVVAVIIILWITFHIFPFFTVHKTEDEAQAINTLLVDLSVGVILNTLFYYLLVKVPQLYNTKRIRKLNQYNVDLIARYMQIIIAYYVNKLHYTPDDNRLLNIKTNIFDGISLPDNSEINFSISFPNYVRKYDGSNEYGLILFYLGQIRNIANQILANPLIIHEDLEFCKTITEISKDEFYDFFKFNASFKGVAKGSFDQNLKSFYKKFLAIDKYSNIEPITINPSLSGSIPFVYKYQ